MRLLCWKKQPRGATSIEASVTSLYSRSAEAIRKKEYPLLQETIYLDHAGTTPYPRSLMEDLAAEMNSKLLGNPHSNSPSSMLSTDVIESTRLQALAFFKADPEHFDLIFVANATAAIKLVMDCLSDHNQRAPSWYSYHTDSHTSLVGIRETAGKSSRCFMSDKEVDHWIHARQSRRLQPGTLQDSPTDAGIRLFAYPAQSNMNGRRLPLRWSGSIRSANTPSGQVFTLLDAAAYVTTAQLDLSDPDSAPDFTALSFYKVFGYPDLGALIVRKASGHVLSERRYFGGGTVDMIVNGTNTGMNTDAWHAKKSTSIHEILEDGTPAFHSILALGLALKVHRRIFGSMDNVSKYTCDLITRLHRGMSKISHANGLHLCKIYESSPSRYGNSRYQGPTIAFNVCNSRGEWIGKSDFERLAILNNVQLRTGGVCNPGGIASALEMSPMEMRNNFDEGLRCGNELDEINGKPTGIVRVSLGAMSTTEDIEYFLSFLQLFVDTTSGTPDNSPSFELVGGTNTGVVSLQTEMLKLDSKTSVCVKDVTTAHTCPVAACMEAFETREALWKHLSIHKLGKTARQSIPKRGGCLAMLRLGL